MLFSLEVKPLGSVRYASHTKTHTQTHDNKHTQPHKANQYNKIIHAHLFSYYFSCTTEE